MAIIKENQNPVELTLGSPQKSGYAKQTPNFSTHYKIPQQEYAEPNSPLYDNRLKFRAADLTEGQELRKKDNSLERSLTFPPQEEQPMYRIAA